MRSLNNLLESDLAMAAAASMLPEAHSLQSLLSAGLVVRVAFVPTPDDPDSFIKKFGGDAFRKLIENAESFFDYYLKRLCTINDPTTDKGRLAISRAMGEAIQKTGNAILIDTYTKKTALRLGISAEATRIEFKKNISGKSSAIENEPSNGPVESELLQSPPFELHLLKLLLLNDELVPWTALHLYLDWISTPIIRKIVEDRLNAQKNESWKSLVVYLDECKSSEVRNFITEAATEKRKFPNPERQLVDVTLKLRNQFLDRQIAALAQKAGLPETPDIEKVELLREQKKLREQKAAPLAAIST